MQLREETALTEETQQAYMVPMEVLAEVFAERLEKLL
jgi:hypothetical protein